MLGLHTEIVALDNITQSLLHLWHRLSGQTRFIYNASTTKKQDISRHNITALIFHFSFASCGLSSLLLERLAGSAALVKMRLVPSQT